MGVVAVFGIVIKLIAPAYRRFWSPVSDRRFWRNWRPLLDQRTVLDRRQFRQLGADDFARLLGARHRRLDQTIPRNIERIQSLAGEFRLLAADFGQVALRIGGAVHVVLAVSHQDQMADGLRFGRDEFLVLHVFGFGRWAGAARAERLHEAGRIATAAEREVESLRLVL